MTLNLIVLEQLRKQQANQFIRLISRWKTDNAASRNVLNLIRIMKNRPVGVAEFFDKLPRALHDEAQSRLVQFVAMTILLDQTKRRNQHFTMEVLKRFSLK